MCGGERSRNSGNVQRKKPITMGMREWKRMDDKGGLHIGWWPGTTDMGVMTEFADLRFPQGKQSVIWCWYMLELHDTKGYRLEFKTIC